MRLTWVVGKPEGLDRGLSQGTLLLSYERASERSVPELFIGTSLLTRYGFLQKNGGKGCHTGQDLVT